ncbi:citron-like protein [Mycena epipterygia]|nr:citron-like protein [Mycena epipterygia]
MLFRPLRLVNDDGLGIVTCAVPYCQGTYPRFWRSVPKKLTIFVAGDSWVFYATADGIYRTFDDGSSSRLLAIRDISQMGVLEDVNLFFWLSGGVFMTMDLDVLNSGLATSTTFKLDAHSNGTSGGPQSRHLICLVKSSSDSGVIAKVLGIKTSSNSRVLEPFRVRTFFVPYRILCKLMDLKEFYIKGQDAYAVEFMSQMRLVVSLRRGFEKVDLESLDTQGLLDVTDRSIYLPAHRKAKPMAIFHAFSVLLLCYDKFGFFVSDRGRMTRWGTIMSWNHGISAVSFALQRSHLLVFGASRVEIWNIETGMIVQKIPGRHLLLNSPKEDGRIIVLSDTITGLDFVGV